MLAQSDDSSTAAVLNNKQVIWCYDCADATWWSRFLHLTINGFPYADRTWQLNKFHSSISVPVLTHHGIHGNVSYRFNMPTHENWNGQKKNTFRFFFYFIFIFEHLKKNYFLLFFKSSWHSGELEEKDLNLWCLYVNTASVDYVSQPKGLYIIFKKTFFLFMAEKVTNFRWLFYSFRKRRNFNLGDSPTLELLIKNEEKNLFQIIWINTISRWIHHS